MRVVDLLEAVDVLALIYADVDRFKQVNDTHGHLIGDRVLAEVGSRLLGSVPPGALVVRLGGDEFLVSVRVTAGDGPVAHRRVAAALAGLTVDGVTVRCSTGLATSDETREPLTLLGMADAAMYRDKAAAG